MTSWRSLCKLKATAGLWWAGMSHFWTWDLRRWWILGWPDNWTLPGPQDRLREQCFPLTDCYPDVCPQYVLYSLLPPLDRGICDSQLFLFFPKTPCSESWILVSSWDQWLGRGREVGHCAPPSDCLPDSLSYSANFGFCNFILKGLNEVFICNSVISGLGPVCGPEYLFTQLDPRLAHFSGPILLFKKVLLSLSPFYRWKHKGTE